MLKNVGTIRLVDPSLPASNLMSHCTSLETQITWNQQGQPGPQGPNGATGPAGPTGGKGLAGTNGTNGTDGTSVLTAAELAGPNCLFGGSSFTAANGVTYACNGAPGDNGTNGTNGTDGTKGTNGTSVTSASEPVGSNCVNGGVALTAANGTSYVCNGSPGKDGTNGVDGAQGPQGQTGATGPQGPQGPPGSGGAASTPAHLVRTFLIDLTDVNSSIATFPSLPAGAWLLTLTGSITTLGSAVTVDCTVNDNLSGNGIDSQTAAFPGELRGLSIVRAIATFGGNDIQVLCRSQTTGGTARVLGVVAVMTPLPGSFITDSP